MLRIAGQSLVPEVSRFPRLQRRLEDTVMDFITGGSGPAEQMIRWGSLVLCVRFWLIRGVCIVLVVILCKILVQLEVQF